MDEYYKMTLEFKAWPKIPRYENDSIVVTEKLDGTNACIAIGTDGEFLVQSRTRIITPESDNYGFATWAYERKEELLKLGHGYHFGEWFGNGINRNYNLKEKHFALFNTQRPFESLPEGVSLVPLLYKGPCTESILTELVEDLKKGSKVNQEFLNVEGMVIYYTQSKRLVKWIINK